MDPTDGGIMIVQQSVGSPDYSKLAVKFEEMFLSYTYNRLHTGKPEVPAAGCLRGDCWC